jgi:hypothetical protein
MFVSSRGWNAIVANKRLGEDENLSTVRRIGHRLRVTNKRSRKDSLARDVRLGTERLAVENRAILEKAKSAKKFCYPANLSHTLIVNVARSWEMGVARVRVTGMARPALPSTVARNRACWAIRLWIPAGLKAAGLTNRANMLKGSSNWR